ncbi:MFS transporter [Heyndrickxia acidicola]|uniref:MFS transporter n=1 Tax=Heyndrickxia acidicola TaxID=209389 RepID=A0ABU6MIQ4_9BACI|nr:MFS transporter [Heyndrickxia acidicola]MED1204339.1 MFS transporter [Heyndrickxia acidicola]
MKLFKNKIFRKLFFASIASQLGSMVGTVAFTFYLLDLFGKKPFLATLAELMYSLPILFVFFLVGVIADRMDRKKITVNTDWIRAALTLILLIAVYEKILWLAFVILFIRSTVSKFFAPAEMSLLQGILDKGMYMQASGLNQTVMGMFMLFGMGIGALSYHYIGITGSVLADGISFILSGLLIGSCAISLEARLPNGKVHFKVLNFSTILKDFKEGLVYILSFKLLKSIIAGFLIFGLINGGFSVLPLFTMKYKLAPAQYQQFSSLFSICMGIGYLLGSAVASRLIQKFKVHRVFIAGIFFSGAVTFTLGMLDNVWFYFSSVVLLGIILAPLNTALSGWMTELVDPKFMGRVSGWIDPLMMLSYSISLGIIAVIFPVFVKVETIYYAIGILMAVVGCYYLIVLPAQVKERGLAGIEQTKSAKATIESL